MEALELRNLIEYSLIKKQILKSYINNSCIGPSSCYEFDLCHSNDNNNNFPRGKTYSKLIIDDYNDSEKLELRAAQINVEEKYITFMKEVFQLAVADNKTRYILNYIYCSNKKFELTNDVNISEIYPSCDEITQFRMSMVKSNNGQVVDYLIELMGNSSFGTYYAKEYIENYLKGVINFQQLLSEIKLNKASSDFCKTLSK